MTLTRVIDDNPPLIIVDATCTTASERNENLSDFYTRKTQCATDDGSAFRKHGPCDICEDSITDKSVIFEPRSPASVYNWEVFLHAPMLIAEFLTKHQRFEDAQKWLHYVFNPTVYNYVFNPTANTRVPKGFWQFLPFQDAGETIQKLFAELVELNVNGFYEQSSIKES